MCKKLLILLICLLPTSYFAQDFSALWNGYFSYFNIKKVVKSGNKVYAAAENAIFTYDINTNEIQEITTINGLSGDNISAIYYSENFELLLIGYDNGLIEVVLDDDENVLTVVDIVDKVTIQPTEKQINHFNEIGNLVYISTDFGISTFDIERLEFGDTFFIGIQGGLVKVNQTALLDNTIYAACSNGGGIRKANINNPNLINFNNWQTIVGNSYIGIESIGSNLYTARSDNRTFQITNDILTEISNYNSPIQEITASNDRLLITTENNVFVYDSTFNLLGQIDKTTEFETKFTSTTYDGTFIYSGTEDFGILKTSWLAPLSFEYIHPDGPLLNRPFKVTPAFNKVWVTFGEYTAQLDPYPLNERGFSILENESWINTPYKDIFEAKELNSVAINPLDINQVFISSFFSGLLEVNDTLPSTLFNTTNSQLESLILANPNDIDIRVGHSQFDEDGLLWTISSKIQRPLKSYNPMNGNWVHYDFSEIIEDALNDNGGFYDFEIAPDGTFFIASRNKGLIGFNPNNGNPMIKSITEEDANFPSVVIRTVALDNRNQLWIGTPRGLRVLFNTSDFFEDNVDVDEIIIEEGGIAQELLFQQSISDIEVDGSNNKWIGTFDSGLYYLSSDGQQTIFRFTKENSPLPSNTVVDIAVDGANGEVYIATDKGLVSFRTDSSSPTQDFAKSHAYPNPVRPGFNIVDEKVKITDLPSNVNIKITDIEGNLVAEAQSRTNQRYNGFNLEIDGGTAFWNGKNLANNIVASGVYLIMLADLDSFETKVVKLMVVR